MAASLILRVDGGSRGNPGPAGYGVLVTDAAGTELARLAASVGIQTNNYAEYCGLIAGLEWALDHGATAVQVYADSQLLVRQIEGRYAVKSPNLLPLYEHARRLLRRIPSFQITHVYRDANREADGLANLAMDQARAAGHPRN